MNPAGLNEAPLTMDTTVRECQSGLQGGGKGDDGKAATGGARYGGPGAPPPLSLSLSAGRRPWRAVSMGDGARCPRPSITEIEFFPLDRRSHPVSGHQSLKHVGKT